WCTKVGRDPQEIERSAQIFGPQLDQLDDYLDAGITHLIGEVSGPDYDLEPLHTLIAWRDRHANRSI
ncbi:MAG: putative F420-dependent oxidoreductase, family, partial [Thermomicrobiales bacterium]|nr:putative F420-dependent oxidoreductase, family [Thermomicrobiales bacterium]